MASCEEDQRTLLQQQSSSLDQGHPFLSSGGVRGRRILLGTLVGVLLVAVLAAVCVVAAVTSSPYDHPNTSDQTTENTAKVVRSSRGLEGKIFGQRERSRRVPPSPIPSRPPPIDTGK